MVTPKTNPVIMNGVAGHFLTRAEDYIHEIFRSIRNYPEGLQYEGYESCTPADEVHEVTRPRNNKRTYDIAKSTIYLCKYHFSYHGKPLVTKYIYLPYLEDNVLLALGGASYQLVPVLSDKVITTTHDSVFIRLLRDKLRIKRAYYSILVNNERFITYIAHSNIYNIKEGRVPKTTKALITLMHYILIKYGFSGAFKRFVGFTPIVGEDDITTWKYPADKYVICSTIDIKPASCMDHNYTPSKIRLAIPIEHWTNETKSLVTSFYYILDHFPNRIHAHSIDDTKIYTILLGHIIFSGHYGENVLYQRICDHFTSLDDYMDPLISNKLSELGYDITDVYQLFGIVASTIKELMSGSRDLNNVYNKNIEVLYYTLYDITSNIFKSIFELNRRSLKKVLTERDMVETLNRFIRSGSIFSLASGKIVTEAVSYSGDHKFINLASKISEQESMVGASRGRHKHVTVGSSNYISPSMVECGELLFLSATNPSPMSRINPYLDINLTNGDIIRSEKLKDILDHLGTLLDN